MKKGFIFFVVLLCLVFPVLLTGCGNTETLGKYQKITPTQAKEIMDGGGDFILLDVRTLAEFTAKRIPSAILIPDFEIAARAESELPDKTVVYLVYCQSGVRSERAARELISMGYVTVYDFGGINGWPYETISG